VWVCYEEKSPCAPVWATVLRFHCCNVPLFSAVFSAFVTYRSDWFRRKHGNSHILFVEPCMFPGMKLTTLREWWGVMLLALLDVYVCCDEAFTVCCPVNDSSSSLVYVVNSLHCVLSCQWQFFIFSMLWTPLMCNCAITCFICDYFLVMTVLWHCRLGHLTCENPSLIWPIMCLVGRSALVSESLVITFLLRVSIA